MLWNLWKKGIIEGVGVILQQLFIIPPTESAWRWAKSWVNPELPWCLCIVFNGFKCTNESDAPRRLILDDFLDLPSVKIDWVVAGLLFVLRVVSMPLFKLLLEL